MIYFINFKYYAKIYLTEVNFSNKKYFFIFSMINKTKDFKEKIINSFEEIEIHCVCSKFEMKYGMKIK